MHHLYHFIELISLSLCLSTFFLKHCHSYTACIYSDCNTFFCLYSNVLTLSYCVLLILHTCADKEKEREEEKSWVQMMQEEETGGSTADASSTKKKGQNITDVILVSCSDDGTVRLWKPLEVMSIFLMPFLFQAVFFSSNFLSVWQLLSYLFTALNFLFDQEIVFFDNTYFNNTVQCVKVGCCFYFISFNVRR